MDNQTTLYEKKMKILLDLRGFSTVKLNDTQALWKINSTASITADVTTPSKHWEVNYKGSKTGDWNAEGGLHASIRGMIQSFEEDFIKACAKVGIILTPNDVGYMESTQEPIEASTPDVKTEELTEEAKPADAAKKEVPAAPDDIISELINVLHILLVTPTNLGFTRTRRVDVGEEVKV